MRLSPSQQRMVVCAAIVVGWLALWSFTQLAFEDALITWRYAENIAAGKGFAFNEGERVLGTTTPLLTLLLAAPAGVLGPSVIAKLTLVLMIACGLLAVEGAYRILRAGGVPHAVALLAVALASQHPGVAANVVGGMEPALVLCLMMWSYERTLSNHMRTAWLLVVLLVLARADGAVWGGLVALTLLVRGRGTSVRAAVPALVVLAIWVVFCVWYFGSPIPHSITAKRAIGPAGTLSHYVRDWAGWILDGLGMHSGFALETRLLGGLWFFAWLAGCRRLLRGRAEAWPFVAVVPGLALFFLAGRAPTSFPWYLVPLTWSGVIAGVVGISSWVEHVIDAERPSLLDRMVPKASLAAIVAPLCVGFVSVARSAYVDLRALQINEQGLRRSAGAWVARHAEPNATVAMEAIGYQGTHSHRHVIDLAGLISPDVVRIRRRARSNAAAFAAILNELRPDYLILRSFEVDQNRHFHGGPLFESAEARERFAECYREAIRLSAPLPDVWGERAYLTIYERVHTRELTRLP